MNIDRSARMQTNELKAERDKVINSLVFPSLFVGLLWLIYAAQQVFHAPSEWFGLFPRAYRGIPGVLTFHLVHGGFWHLYYNSIALFVLGTLTFYFYRGIAFTAFCWIYLMTGVWLWAFGRDNSCHIGASGLVYGLLCFLFFSGVFRRDRRLLLVSVLVLTFYGSLATGIFPLTPEISWEGHMMGSLSGIATAWFYRNEGPQKQQHFWSDEEDEDEKKWGIGEKRFH
ncbi:MAG TPA: rhomboid family intramembrane serine protease [Bacteroidia bacterium]